MFMTFPNQPGAACFAGVDPAVRTTVAHVGDGYKDRKAWSRVREAIRKLKLLHDDWDGEGSDAPTRDLVETAIGLVDAFERMQVRLPTTAVATRAGTVLFGWREGPIYEEIDVVAPDRLEWMMTDQTGPATHGEISLAS